ncbi:MAG TPA: FtsK/SpoIIIE domain-containing protein, partial [Pedococcus sp.]
MLQITLVHADRPGETREVEVDTRGDDTVDALAAALVRTVGRAWGGHLHLRGRPLAPQATLDEVGLLDGAVLTVAGSPLAEGRPAPPTSPLAVAVVGGPDAGNRVALRPGTVRIGRSREADVVVDDPELSRVHALLEVGPDAVLLRDCGSTNGTFVDGRRVPPEGCAVDIRSLVTLGSTRLRLRPTATRPAAVGPVADGVRLVNRAPRIHRDPAAATLTLPDPPTAPARAGLPWAALLLPLPVGIVLALVFSPVMLLVSFMSPLLAAGTALTDRVTGRRRYAAQLAAHREAVHAVEAAAAQAVSVEERWRRLALPDPAEVLAVATSPTSRLWERGVDDPDALHVALGSWSTPSGVRLDDPAGPPRRPACQDVPCALPLAEVGVLGVAGPSGAVRALARSAVGQLVALRSPRDLRVLVLAADAEAASSWAWATRVPHAAVGPGGAPVCGRPRRGLFTATDPDGLAATTRMLLEDIDARGTSPEGGRHTVVVLDGAERLRRLPGVAELLARGPAAGVVAVALDTHGDRLPPECGAVLDLGPGAASLRSRVGPTGTGLVPDGVGPWWADRLSRALAPLRDATPGATEGLPSSVRLLDLLPDDVLDPGALARRWARAPRSTRAVLGVGADGPHHVDLLTDGPHLLVGGTTGSGKSELLQTLIASLAVANRPDQLAFLLLDYKGGAAFADGARLPHTVGLVTDLDDGLAERALVSLTAELKRRERCLAEAGVVDLDAYLRLADAGLAPTLPRLVIVIDEFRVLAEELPEFLRGLVRVAAVGRSLGVHLVLATQRPAGVVSADIKANVNLRIALRMRDRSDSEDVIEAPDAARLDEARPGRALARTGAGSLDRLQVARVGGRPPAARRGPTVTLLDGPRPIPPGGRLLSDEPPSEA